MKNNPLLIDGDKCCIIANPFKWTELFGETTPDFMKDMGIEVVGCTVTFPDDETKSLFFLKYL